MTDEERERIQVSGPMEVDRGYFELRVNFTGGSLLAMSGEELDRLHIAITMLRHLAGST